MRNTLMVAVTAVLAFLTFGCSMFGYTDEPLEIAMHGASFSLAWDPPAAAGTSSMLRVDSYEIVYRNYPASFLSSWTSLAAVPPDGGFKHVVTNDELEPGRYEFAVRSVYADGSRSDYHRSTESNAHPPTGWYLNWLGG